MNEEYSYISYTFFKNRQKMKEKPPWCLFEIYHLYDFSDISLCNFNKTLTNNVVCLNNQVLILIHLIWIDHEQLFFSIVLVALGTYYP